MIIGAEFYFFRVGNAPPLPSPSSSSWAGGWKQNFDNVEFFLFFIFIFHRKWPRYLSKNEENLTYCSEVQCQVLVLECFWINIVPQLSIVCQTGENFWKCHSSLLFAGFNQKTKPIYVSLWLFFLRGTKSIPPGDFFGRPIRARPSLGRTI